VGINGFAVLRKEGKDLKTLQNQKRFCRRYTKLKSNSMKDKHIIFAVAPNKVFRKDLAQLFQSNAKATKLKLHSKIENPPSEKVIPTAQLGILERFGCCFLITGTLIQALEYEGLNEECVVFLRKNVLKILII
jgi:hypothetical protein